MIVEQKNNIQMHSSEFGAAKKSKDKINAIIGVSLTILAAFGHGTIISYLATIAFVIYALTLPMSERALFVIIGLTNTRALEIFGMSASVAICFISCILCLIKKNKLDKKLFTSILLYLLYSVQFCLRDAGITYGIVIPIKIVAVLLFYYFLSNDLNVRNKPIEFVYRSSVFYFIGATGAVLGSVGDTGRLAVAGNDSNALALQMVFLIAMFTVLYFRFSVFSIWKFAFYVAVAMVIGLMTGSRTFLVLAVGTVVGTVIFNFSRFRKVFWLVVILIIGGYMFLSSEYGQAVVQLLIERQGVLEAQGNISNGRFDLWKQYIEYLNNNHLWLIGVGDYRLTGFELVAHNMIIEGVVLYGVIGILLLCNMYRLIIKNFLKITDGNRSKGSLYIYMPLLLIFIGNFVLHDLTNIYNTSMIFLSVILISGYKKEHSMNWERKRKRSDHMRSKRTGTDQKCSPRPEPGPNCC